MQLPQCSTSGASRRQLQRREDRAQKEPVPQIAAQQVRVLALPAQTRRLRERLLHHRRGIDEDLDLAARRLDQPSPQTLQPPLDQIVVILPLRIDTDRPPVALIQHRQRIGVGRIDLGQHDDRPRLWPKRCGTAPPFGPLGHPAHLPVMTLGKPGRQPPRPLRHRIRCADPDGREPLLQRLRHQPFLESVRHLSPGPESSQRIRPRRAAQKSRSA